MDIARRRLFIHVSRQFIALLLIVICIGVLIMPANAAPAGSVVKVGCFPLNGFYNISDGRLKGGYGADYTESVFQEAGMPYEYVIYTSWVEALNALSKNEIDMLAPAQRTSERDALYSFDSFPIGTEYGALLTLSTNDDLIYEDFSSFDGLSVGVVPSLVFLDDFKKYEELNGFSVDFVSYKDTASLVAALNAGDVEAALVNMMVKTPAMKLLARFGAAPIYYMFSRASGGLCQDISLAIDQLTSAQPDLQSDLFSTYFSDFSSLPFTKAELDYIANCGTLNVACGVDFPPFSYLDKETGEITGVGCAYTEEVASLSGLTVAFQAIPFGVDVPDFIKEHNIAFVPGVESYKPGKLNGESYSQSYMTVYKYFIGKRDTVFDKTVASKVACLNFSQAQLDNWKAVCPNFEFIRYDTIDACLKAVHSGEADYHLNDRYSMESFLSAPHNSDLKMFPDGVIVSPVCFKITVGGDEAELLTSILNKTINQIPETDKEKLISDFTEKNSYQYTVSDFVYQYRFQLTIACIIIIAAAVALALIVNSKKKFREAVRDSEMTLRNITNNINGGVVVLKANEGLNITFANDGFLELIGCSREEFARPSGDSYLAYIHPDDLPRVQETIESDEREFSIKLRVMKRGGGYVPALFNCTVGDEKEGYKELYCVILDMTEQDRLVERLRVEKRRTDLILERVDEIFYEVNLLDHTVTTSPSFMGKMGWTLPNHLPESTDDYFVKTWLADEEDIDKIRQSTIEMLASKRPCSLIVRLESKKENRSVWCEISQHPILSTDGSVVSVIGLLRNVDRQITEREQLIEQARHDPLTGLYNKEAFELLVSETLKQMPDENHALVFIDLDHFKSVNDTLGHMVGDRAICEAADTLRIIFSNFDLIARFGGDEFCVFVKNIPFETLRGKLSWLVEKLHAQYYGNDSSVHITCSCGAACTEGYSTDYQTLMRSADKALYIAKEQGRDQFTFFEEL